MRYWILVIYFAIYKDKTFLTCYVDHKTNTLKFYWGHYSMESTKFNFRENIIRNIYFKYRDMKVLLESLNLKDETICIDGCPIKTNDPTVIEFDTYA